MPGGVENCAVCREEIRQLRSSNVAFLVQGWASPRRAGGTNHIQMQEKMGPVAHVTCLEGARFDPSTQMDSLFGDAEV